MTLDNRWACTLEKLQQLGRYRSLQPASGVDFASNDYLGYSGSRGQWSVVGGRWPAVSGTASRLLRGHHPLWDEVEHALASWHRCEAALMMTSGYQANEGLLSTVIEPQDWVASDRFNHASIIDGLRLTKAERFVFRHNDLNHLEDGLRKASGGRQAARQLFVVVESLNSMEGDAAPLVQMADLAARYDANLIVDEAHATGCFGAVGSGLVDREGIRERVTATVHTGGKALGVMGAYICGAARLKELLINECRHLMFSTALPPVVASWWLTMLPFVQADREGRQLLHDNARRLRELLAQRGVNTIGAHYIVPVIIGEDAAAVAVANRLQKAGFDVRAIRPPTVPEGTSRLRISIHADHDSDMLAGLTAAIGSEVSSQRSVVRGQ